mmetsp:Transcript_17240/g.33597  ORF Transcript_17240/g.33597 Transcript_17240/m.33597 type:complete len:157 (-) Transcript_17240:1080-1550(-)
MQHVIERNHNCSALKFLRAAQLIDEEIATIFKAIGKHYQRAWRKMVEPEVIDCARGEDCTDSRQLITTSETGSWTVDLPMARYNIVKALVQLRDDDKLETVYFYICPSPFFSLCPSLFLSLLSLPLSLFPLPIPVCFCFCLFSVCVRNKCVCLIFL